MTTDCKKSLILDKIQIMVIIIINRKIICPNWLPPPGQFEGQVRSESNCSGAILARQWVRSVRANISLPDRPTGQFGPSRAKWAGPNCTWGRDAGEMFALGPQDNCLGEKVLWQTFFPGEQTGSEGFFKVETKVPEDFFLIQLPGPLRKKTSWEP